MPRSLLDTDILSEVLKGVDPVVITRATEYRAVFGQYIISTITVMEAGRIFADLECAGQPIGRADPMVAAIAIQHGLTLVTGNTAHYERVRNLGYPLVIDNWRE